MSLKSIYKKAPISDRNAVLTFGKYRGESIADILETDAQYLVWLHDNNDFFELDHLLLDEAERGKTDIDWRSCTSASYDMED